MNQKQATKPSWREIVFSWGKSETFWQSVTASALVSSLFAIPAGIAAYLAIPDGPGRTIAGAITLTGSWIIAGFFMVSRSGKKDEVVRKTIMEVLRDNSSHATVLGGTITWVLGGALIALSYLIMWVVANR